MSTTQALRSCDLRLPLWLRLAALAVERGEADVLGTVVAEFEPGEVRKILGRGVSLAPSAVTRAVRLAESHGLLAPGSSVRCLRVVPGSLTTGVTA